MTIRNRIKGHRRVRAGDLLEHEWNYRVHPDQQREALAGIYREVGFARSLLAYELADAKAYLTGSFPLTIETPNAIATQIVNVLFYGLPVSELQTFRERVNAVTVDDIQRVAKLYVKPDQLSVVLVGNAKEFANQLQGIGFSAFETVDLQNLDLASVDFKRAAPRAEQPGGIGVPAPKPAA